MTTLNTHRSGIVDSCGPTGDGATAVARYKAASAERDVDALMATLAPDAELVSPISGRMVFRGHTSLRVLLSAIYKSMHGLQWGDEVGDETTRLALGEASVGPFRIGDAMVFELAEDGQIRRIRPHLRPWLAVTFLALKLAVKLVRHPRVVRRALSRA